MKTTPIHKLVGFLLTSIIIVSVAVSLVTGQEPHWYQKVRDDTSIWLVCYFLCMAIDRLADEVTLLRGSR